MLKAGELVQAGYTTAFEGDGLITPTIESSAWFAAAFLPGTGETGKKAAAASLHNCAIKSASCSTFEAALPYILGRVVRVLYVRPCATCHRGRACHPGQPVDRD